MTLLLLFLCPLAFLSPLTAMLLQDEDILTRLQTQESIPTFSVQRTTTLSPRNVEELSLPTSKFKLLAGKNTFILIPLESTEIEQPIFDASTLAWLYTYAIGLNEQEGTRIASQWSTWSQLVPPSFLVQVEDLLKHQYPTFEKRIKETFQNQTYAISVDTSLVDKYVTIIKAILTTYSILPDHEKHFVKTISRFLTQGAVIRNPSPTARWTSHAKEAIIKVLNAHHDGKTILKELAQGNPILAQEIEVYTSSFTID